MTTASLPRAPRYTLAEAPAFSPAGCAACGNPDAPLRPHGHGRERLCVTCWSGLVRLRASAARYGWRTVRLAGDVA